MKQLYSRLTLGLLSLLMLGLTVPTFAQAAATQKDKSALIKELLEVTQASQLASDTMNEMLGELERQMMPLFDRLAARVEGQSDAERQRKLKAISDKFLLNFRNELPKHVNLGKLMEEITTPIYADLLNKEDLQNLITFYRTPAGQKAIKILPQVMSRTMRETENKIKEPVTELTKTLMGDVFKELEREFPASSSDQGPPPPPAPKKP
jgi:hypothetical protein